MAAALLASAGSGCSSAVPAPRYVQVVAEDYVPVPFMPRPPPVEIVPARPKAPSSDADLVWADGGWEWGGERYRWEPGAWVAVPPGAKRARWVIVRRAVDGQLFLAPSSWRDDSGRLIEPPAPLARAVTRPGEESGSSGSSGSGAPAGGGAGGDAGAPSAPAARTDLDE